MNEITTLQALLDDVKGNDYLGDAKKMSGYLKSIVLLADAMARRSWQQFELDVNDELKAVKCKEEMKTGLETKRKLAQREFELAELQVKLMAFHVNAAADVYITKECAAGSLRRIADDLEKSDSELFPKPWTQEDARAYAKRAGVRYAEEGTDFEEVLRSQSKTSRPTSKSKVGKRRTATA